jgi:branched-chain amino acid transport system ATP-binding protein
MRKSSDNPVLEVISVSAGYNGRSVLRNLSLTIQSGENVALIGPNGCGKSTLIRVVAGLVSTTAGDVRLCTESLGRETADVRARRGIGTMKQTGNIFATLSVQENLELAGRAARNCGAVDSRLAKLIEGFPMLASRLETRAGLLSGGQRQALAAAMVLMRPAHLLLLDEPVAGLSPRAGTELLLALQRLQKVNGFAMIIVEHRLRQVQPYVNRVLVMREGKVVDDTSETERMLDADWVADHYHNGNERA